MYYYSEYYTIILYRHSGIPSKSAARSDDLKCRPFRKKFFGQAQKDVKPLAKISDDFFCF